MVPREIERKRARGVEDWYIRASFALHVYDDNGEITDFVDC
jgi:hypothetical protein